MKALLFFLQKRFSQIFVLAVPFDRDFFVAVYSHYNAFLNFETFPKDSETCTTIRGTEYDCVFECCMWQRGFQDRSEIPYRGRMRRGVGLVYTRCGIKVGI